LFHFLNHPQNTGVIVFELFFRLLQSELSSFSPSSQ